MVKPEKFNYLRPATTVEALELLSKYGYEASLMAGGQSLIPILNMRLAAPEYLIDLGNLTELEYIKKVEDRIVIGALTKQADVEHSSLVENECPLLKEAIEFVGNFQIRNRGTVGGSIAHADPSSELPCVLSALRGRIVIANSDGERIVSTEEFFLSYLLTSLDPSEMVKEVHFPIISPTSGYAFVQKSRRHGDFSLAGVASVLDLDEQGNISLARLAVCGASPVPCVLDEIEAFLIGKKPSEQIFIEAAEKVKQFVEPEDDIHGSAAYRRHLASVLTKRSLNIAAERAVGGR